MVQVVNKWVTLKRVQIIYKLEVIIIFMKLYYYIIYYSEKNYDELQFINNSRNMKKKIKFKKFKVMNLRSKIYLISCFYALLLMIGFEDLILIF